jgi:hypothetical protein
MAIPTVSIGTLNVSRFIIGGNPFSGFSHQTPERDQEMLDWYTVERIKEVLHEAEALGLNTTVMRTDAFIYRVWREFRNEGGGLRWIAQMDPSAGWQRSVDEAVANGASGYYIHGAVTDQCFADGNLDHLAEIIAYAQSKGLVAGLAGHAPEAHLAVYEAGIPADFHVVCFYNCGSLHAGGGDHFDPSDPARAVEVIRHIQKPCIGYKIMGAGRVPAQQALEFAFANIKPTDAVNVGIFTGDNPNMVVENVRFVERLLA